ncbi:hypothetical protein [Flavonifractor plautii]|jgi:hypothetical protein|uniref:hypothetical protein n=1 Tax=Flavonifractor plautii TaxID=292800 RepID=UPI000465A697|nr:hypothetical protein [Flavonifractor plautii]
MKTDTIKNTGLCRRALSPFDDSATERRRRMGLVSETGEPDQNSIEVLSHVFAAQYFDDLCDFCQSIDDVQAALTPFIDAAEKAEPKQRFLLMCLQYDAIYRALPEPVWWISGAPDLAALFSAGFVSHLRRLAEKEVESE